VIIPRRGVIRLKQLGELLGIRGIEREVRCKRLRVHKVANKYYCLGSDVWRWLEEAPAHGRRERVESNGVHSP
jgi:hypothetical protein